MIDVQEKKRKIISFLEENGPSLPVRIAREIQMDPVFASAILSELLGSKQVKLSHMKIGSSPLYLLPNQEKRLEEQTDNLKSVEKEAYLKLKENKLITDENESPAIRVALRNIKDFAVPFKFQEKIMWKYAFVPEEEIEKLLSPTEEEPEVEEEVGEEKPEEEVPKAWEVKKEEIKQAKEESKKIENIFTEKKEPEVKSNKPKTFLKQVEEFLENKGTKIISIQEVDKKKVVAKTESRGETAMLFAFNKKKIMEDELIKCYKQARDANLPYQIIILGDLTKKMTETIDAYKKLLGVAKLE